MDPVLTDEQWTKLLAHGTPRDVTAGEYLVRAGQPGPALVVVESGTVQVVRDALRWMDEEIIGDAGAREFIGELSALNGQRPFLSLRVTEPGRVHLVERADLRAIMDEDDDLCDLLLRVLWERREALRHSTAAMTLKLVGEGDSSDFLALRRFAERFDLVHKAWPIDRADFGQYEGHGFTVDDLPVALIQGEPIKNATPGIVAEHLV